MSVPSPPLSVVKADEIKLLDHGFVRLDASSADDLSVVNSARVSFGTRKEEMGKDDEGLIRFLMQNRHGTPFEHNMFRWHVKAPLSVFREWQRHRIGSFNEMSGRYKVFENPDFYIPESEAVRTQIGRPGAYTFETMEDDIAASVQGEMEIAYQSAYYSYKKMLEVGVAKELARQVLPLGMFSEMYWTVNARSMMNFLSLRCAPEAMFEIRQYANAILEVFKEKMPVTATAFAETMVAP